MAKTDIVSKTASSGVKIMECDCLSEYQDKRYGSGRRVCNPTSKGYRCTVCAKNK